jgi:riboflavin synthase
LGHIDDTGEVTDVTGEETARIMRISAAAQLMPYIVSKGFIAVDGVSLTIVNSAELFLIVSSVAYTSKQTTLGSRMRGDIVNLETDIIAKYVERFTKGQARSLDFELLKEYGFVGQTDGS